MWEGGIDREGKTESSVREEERQRSGGRESE